MLQIDFNFRARRSFINEPLIRTWSRRFHEYAKTATAHLSDPGVLQVDWLDAKRQRPRPIGFARFEIGEHQDTADFAIAKARAGYNVYIEARTITRGSPGRGDTRWVLGLVIDFDGAGIVPFPETFSVETSPGHSHHWYLTTANPENGHVFGERLRSFAGADGDTGVVKQPYIFPGTPNYPTAEKVQSKRRTTVARTFLKSDGGPSYSCEELEALLPALHSTDTTPVAFDPPTGRSLDQIREHLWTKAGMAYKRFTLPFPDRSLNFSRACFIAFQSGLSPAEIELFIWNDAKNGCASKWIELGKLREQLASQWRDWSALRTKATGG